MSVDIDTNETPPLDHESAAELDERIRRTAKATKGNLDALENLIEKARAGQIHAALSYISWTAYLTDALQDFCADVDGDTRRHVAVILHHEGMSIRDAAQATGQSKSTVQREVSQLGTVEGRSDVTVGHDNKVRARKQRGDRREHSLSLRADTLLFRAQSTIRGISGLPPEAVEKQTAICNLIDELLASIQPATGTPFDATEVAR